jgi:2-polyprenyl-6-methoxyphenol hydroxylase-like FAD-dependent oxidoreductase
VSAGEEAKRRATVHGSGPAALATAITLAQSGWSVCIRPTARSARQAARVDVLEGAALPVLSYLGIQRQDLLDVARPCPGIWSHWGMEPHAKDHFAGLHGPAWAVMRPALEEMMISRATALDIDQCEAIAGADDGWQIVAVGRLGTAYRVGEQPVADDELVAFIGTGIVSSDEAVDARLLIEAVAEGWCYGVMGPNGAVCLGFITDKEELVRSQGKSRALDALEGTARISRLLHRLKQPLKLSATAVPCRWLPLMADARTIRVGDAQASYDPIAGRGLWSALTRSTLVAKALARNARDLTDVAQLLRRDYERYAAEREALYREALARFGTGFWARRCA